MNPIQLSENGVYQVQCNIKIEAKMPFIVRIILI